MQHTSTVGMKTSPYSTIVLWLIVLALALRLGAAAWLGPSIATRGNGINHVRPLAVNLLACKGYCVTPGVPSVYLEPGYPAFMAAAYAVFGQNWWSLAAAQTLLAAATLLIAYRLASSLFGPATACLTVGLLAVYPYLVLQTVGLIDTTLLVFWLIACTWAAYRAAESPKYAPAIAAGLLMGLAVLSRKTIMLAAPVYAVMLFFPPTGQSLADSIAPAAIRRAGTKLLLAALAAMAVVSPWLARNYQLTGRFPLIAIHPIDGVWLGNNPRTREFLDRNLSLDALAELPEIRGSRLDPVPLHRSLPPREAVRRADLYRAEIVRFVKQNPEEVLRMVPIRLWGLWTWTYNPRPTNGTPIPALKQWTHRLSYGPLLLLAVAGLLLGRGQWRRLWPLPAIMVLYTVGHLPAIGYSRLRLPLDTLLAMLAAYALVAMAVRFPRARLASHRAHDEFGSARRPLPNPSNQPTIS